MLVKPWANVIAGLFLNLLASIKSINLLELFNSFIHFIHFLCKSVPSLWVYLTLAKASPQLLCILSISHFVVAGRIRIQCCPLVLAFTNTARMRTSQNFENGRHSEFVWMSTMTCQEIICTVHASGTLTIGSQTIWHLIVNQSCGVSSVLHIYKQCRRIKYPQWTVNGSGCQSQDRTCQDLFLDG